MFWKRTLHYLFLLFIIIAVIVPEPSPECLLDRTRLDYQTEWVFLDWHDQACVCQVEYKLINSI